MRLLSYYSRLLLTTFRILLYVSLAASLAPAPIALLDNSITIPTATIEYQDKYSHSQTKICLY
ncbi:hypothetical protein DSUL_20222 [Desulfovibrionales bacterium]